MEPVDNRAVVDLLGALAYAELTAFDRLAEDARLAPNLTGRAALARMAAAEIGHHVRLTDRIAELGGNPANAMAPFVSALDAFHNSTRPSTWLEGLVKAYVGDGLAADFYREIAAFLPGRGPCAGRGGARRHRALGLRRPRGPRRGERQPQAGRTAVAVGRRLVGEAMSQSQAVIAEHDRLGELIISGTGDLAGVALLIDRITAAHTQRMKTLGLNP